MKKCKYADKCGGCIYSGMDYEEQLSIKQKNVNNLLKEFCKVQPIIGMKNPLNYRNKVHAVLSGDKQGNIYAGTYESRTHRVVSIDSCYLDNEKADEIINTIVKLMKSFKYRPYNEDTGRGFLRHILLRTAHATGEIMVVLVVGEMVFPSKNNFIKALLKEHPKITTIVMNLNNRKTSMVLGDREEKLYGPGFIIDELCGCRFKISSKSFYQINSVQTEVLYRTAITYAGLTGKERVIDAYSGIGTIGIAASSHAGEVVGIELNKDAVRDAVNNCRANNVKNARYYAGDAGQFMVSEAENKAHYDVVFMDPPRAGSDEKFLSSIVKLKPEKVVYVSCNPETLQRDLKYLVKKGYNVKKCQPVDMFPMTGHVETIAQLHRTNSHV